MGGVLVYIEHVDGEADRVSLEALALARSITGGAGGGGVAAVVAGAPADGLAAIAASLGAHGATSVHVVEDPRLDAFAPAALAVAVAAAAGAGGASVVVGPGTDRGNEVFAYLGARLGLPMAANVMAVDAASADEFRVTRQRWAGSLIEDARLQAPVRLLTVAPHAVAVAETAGAGAPAVVPLDAALSDADFRVRVARREPPAAGSVSLADARVVVSGGRGVGSAEGFAVIEELAGLLGGAVGVSRAVTSAGWRPHAEQVGQTGTRVAPDLYVACGISGAIQHIVGCKAAKKILAINTDAESPIMARADYAVIGDLHAILPAISAEIRRVRGG